MSIQLKIFSMLLGVIFFAGCARGKREQDLPDTSKVVEKKIQKPASSFNDTLAVEHAVAVFFQLDSVQLEKFRSGSTSMVYESTTHDCFFQMKNAREVLRKYWPGIQVIECRNYRYLECIKADKSKVYVNLDEQDMCGILMFNGQKDPQSADMMNIETELAYYFKPR